MRMLESMPPMDLLRSEKMSFVQLIMPVESAHRAVSYLGELGLLQFRDVRFLASLFLHAVGIRCWKEISQVLVIGRLLVCCLRFELNVVGFALMRREEFLLGRSTIRYAIVMIFNARCVNFPFGSGATVDFTARVVVMGTDISVFRVLDVKRNTNNRTDPDEIWGTMMIMVIAFYNRTTVPKQRSPERVGTVERLSIDNGNIHSVGFYVSL
ncbi:hypothetical protein ACLOJK_001553 [Asimina triloba]